METGATEEKMDAAAQSAPEAAPATDVQPAADAQPAASGEKQNTPAPKDSHKKHHHGRRDQGDKHAPHAKPAPQGALQEALKKTAPDWKAYRDQQIAAGREQRTFWLTEEETERVRAFLRRLRDKTEKQGQKGNGKKKKNQHPHGPVNKSVPNPLKAKKAPQAKEAAALQEAPKPVAEAPEAAPAQE